jgi:hypothetical protein
MSLIIGDARSIHGRTISSDAPISQEFLMWDGGASEIVYSSAVTPPRTACISFTYSTISPFTIHAVTLGDIIISCRIHIETVFDGISTVSVGHSGSAIAIMDTTENSTLEVGDYESTRWIEYGGSDLIKLYITPGTSVRGTGYVYLTLTKAE